jgi:hypothetical protein
VRFVVGAIALGYLVLLVSNTCLSVTGTDSAGYLSHARLVASGTTSADIPQMRALSIDPRYASLFTPHGFTPGSAGRMVPTYPVGTSLHLAAAAIIGGWRVAPFLVSPLLGVGSLILLVAVAQRLGIRTSWAVGGAAILAASPVFVLHSLQAMSDVVATFWTLLAMWLALRERPAASGVAFAIGVAVRPVNLLLALPLAIAFRFRPARLVVAAAAALPIGAALLWYQAHLYGSPWKTGYGGAGSVISFLTLPPCLSFHVTTLARMMTPAIMPLGLVAMFDRKHDRFDRALLATWFGVFFVFYAFYGYCADWSASRFLLPAIAPLIIGLLWFCERIPRPAAIALVVAVVGWEVAQFGRLHLLQVDDGASVLPRTVAWVEHDVPPNATVLANTFSGVFYYHSGRITPRWDQLDASTSAFLRARDAGSPWFAVVTTAEGGKAELVRHVPGNWMEAGRLGEATLLRLAD